FCRSTIQGILQTQYHPAYIFPLSSPPTPQTSLHHSLYTPHISSVITCATPSNLLTVRSTPASLIFLYTPSEHFGGTSTSLFPSSAKILFPSNRLLTPSKSLPTIVARSYLSNNPSSPAPTLPS